TESTTDLKGRAGKLDVRGGRFGDYDFGTFKEQRTAMYSQIADQEKVHAVFTGHSHRKGLYFLDRRGFSLHDTPTTMSNFDQPIQVSALPGKVSDDTPIIVSDSGGPLPRFNLHGEFKGWGSDRPSGTFARFSGKGLVGVEALRSSGSRSKPRLVV